MLKDCKCGRYPFDRYPTAEASYKLLDDKMKNNVKYNCRPPKDLTCNLKNYFSSQRVCTRNFYNFHVLALEARDIMYTIFTEAASLLCKLSTGMLKMFMFSKRLYCRPDPGI